MQWKKKQKREKKSHLKKKAHEPVKSPGKLKVKIEYRDASNYKTNFDHEIDLKKFPDAATLKKGDEIKMGQYGTLKEEGFFGSEIHPHDYNEDDDHNLLEITEIIKD